jgi:hypothetical protein
MDDARAVRAVEGRGALDRRLQSVVERQRASRQPILQCLTFEMLHHQEREAVLLAHVVERAEVLMIEGGNRARLPLEAVTNSDL